MSRSRGVKPYAGLMLGYQWSKDNYKRLHRSPRRTAASVPLSASAPVSLSTQGTTTTTTTYSYAGGATATYVNTSTRSNRPVWGVSTGVEVPFRECRCPTPHIAYFDPMKAHSQWQTSYGLEGHHWFQ